MENFLLIRELAISEREHVCACMASLSPWAELEAPYERLLEALITDNLREAWVCVTQTGELVGTIMFRRVEGIPYISERGFEITNLADSNLCESQTLIRGLSAAYVNAMAVFPNHQRRGVGRRLMAHAEALSIHQASHMFLSVTESNEAARLFYLCMGYRSTGRVVRNKINGSYSLLMMKTLS